MPKLIATHEVAHWLASPKREEVFADVAKNICTYLHPEDPDSVGFTMEVDDISAFQKIIQSAAVLKYDGARPDTAVVLIES